MMKILTIVGQADVLIIAVGVLICTVSKTARKVRTELKRWKSPAQKTNSPKVQNSPRKISR